MVNHMPIVGTSAKGQVLIPVALRKRIGLKSGGKALVTLTDDNRLLIEPVADDPIEAACGFLAQGPSLTQALTQEHREEQKRDQAKRARLVRADGVSRKRVRVRNGSRSAA